VSVLAEVKIPTLRLGSGQAPIAKGREKDWAPDCSYCRISARVQSAESF